MIRRLVEEDLQMLFDLLFIDFYYGMACDQVDTTVGDSYESTFPRMVSSEQVSVLDLENWC